MGKNWHLAVSGLMLLLYGQSLMAQVKVLEPTPNKEVIINQDMTIEAIVSPLPAKKRLFMTAVISLRGEVLDRVPLYDDGDPDHADREAGDGIYANTYKPRREGELTLRVKANWDNEEVWSDPVPFVVRAVQRPLPEGVKPIPTPFPPPPSKSPTKPIGGFLALLGTVSLLVSLFFLRQTVQPQGGLSVELRFLGKREALLTGPRGQGDFTLSDQRFADLKLALLRWQGLSGLIVVPLQAKQVWVEETKSQRLREGLNRIKVSHTLQGIPISGEFIVKVNRFTEENRFPIFGLVIGGLLLFIGFILFFL